MVSAGTGLTSDLPSTMPGANGGTLWRGNQGWTAGRKPDRVRAKYLELADLSIGELVSTLKKRLKEGQSVDSVELQALAKLGAQFALPIKVEVKPTNPELVAIISGACLEAVREFAPDALLAISARVRDNLDNSEYVVEMMKQGDVFVQASAVQDGTDQE